MVIRGNAASKSYEIILFIQCVHSSILPHWVNRKWAWSYCRVTVQTWSALQFSRKQKLTSSAFSGGIMQPFFSCLGFLIMNFFGSVSSPHKTVWPTAALLLRLPHLHPYTKTLKDYQVPHSQRNYDHHRRSMSRLNKGCIWGDFWSLILGVLVSPTAT